jgi:chemotaxis protein MotB
MWNNLSKGLLAAMLVVGALAAYLFWDYAAQYRRADESEKKAEAVSKEKAGELARLKKAQDEMLKSLQQEVEKGEVTISRLADRLSVQILDKILFASGEATISAKGRDVLVRVGKVLADARGKDKIIRIEGHTDNVPIGESLREKFPTNWELSTARATNVVRLLIESSKIPPDALEVAGLGEHHPVAGNDTPEGRRQNRRIEIIFYSRAKSLAKELPKTKEQPAAAGKPSP